MCGVPFHSADTYIARLVEKGYKVAICEQVEDPAAAKGIVKREVIQIVTPGTVTSQTPARSFCRLKSAPVLWTQVWRPRRTSHKNRPI